MQATAIRSLITESARNARNDLSVNDYSPARSAVSRAFADMAPHVAEGCTPETFLDWARDEYRRVGHSDALATEFVESYRQALASTAALVKTGYWHRSGA